MSAHFSALIFSGFSARFARAAACFSSPKARMISRGMVSIPMPMGKCSRLRSVCAPQYLSAGTRTSPMESCSIRYSNSLTLPFVGACFPSILPQLLADCHRLSACFDETVFIPG